MAGDRNYIVLWPTDRCNLKCRYCYAYSEGRQSDMSFETAKRVLDYFTGEPMKIQFAGGEPLLNIDLIKQIYSYVKTTGNDTIFQLQTNGTLIDSKNAQMIAQMRMRTGVSLDGPVYINEQLRGETHRVLEGIRNLAYAGVKVNLNATVTSMNVDQLPELLELALYSGNISGIGLDLIRFSGRAGLSSNTLQKPSEEQLIKALYALYEKSNYLYESTGIKIGIRSIEEAKQRLKFDSSSGYYCYASCGKSYVILPDGAVYPCGTLAGRQEYFMGNVNDGKIRPLSLPSLPQSEKCRACKYRKHCPGSCPSRQITNGYTTPDDSLDCVLRKTSFELAEAEIKATNNITT